MNHADLATSPRLQRVHALLIDGQPRTTLEIVMGAQVCAVNAVIAELRENGAVIECRRKGTPEGWRWYYTMTRPVPGAAHA